MKTRTLTLILSLLVLVLAVSSCSSGASSTSPAPTAKLDGATLVQERCSVCHPVARIERTKHTAADWKTIVDLMISRGAQLSTEEETLVVSYLVANFGQ
jgi:hypothetical protein